MPVTMPEVPTVAIPGALLLHVPPGVPSVRSVVWPTHADAEPVIAAAVAEFTVTGVVAMQPLTEYVIVAIPPVPTPVTMPPVPTVATAILLLDHVPPGDVSLKRVVDPEQTVVVPVIADAPAVTVTSVAAEVVLHPEVLVTTTV